MSKQPAKRKRKRVPLADTTSSTVSDSGAGPSKRRRKNSEPLPEPEHTAPVETGDLIVRSSVTKRNSAKQEPFIIRFQIEHIRSGNDHKFILKAQENEKAMKLATAASLLKYKNDVFVEFLRFYFRFSLAFHFAHLHTQIKLAN